MVFVGIDLHKTYSYVVAMDQAGQVLDERRLRNQAVAQYMAQFEAPVRVTLEATYNWQMMFEHLEGRVAEIVLAHPKNVRAIAERASNMTKSMRGCWPTYCGLTWCRRRTFRPARPAICAIGCGIERIWLDSAPS
jgi:hypothetical protein